METATNIPHEGTGKTVTIQDVAKVAGVSVSTVSRVLNDKDDVALETYRKVQNSCWGCDDKVHRDPLRRR